MRTHIIALIGLIFSAPAMAGSGTPIPEPSNLALMAMGLTGLIVGRIMVKRSHTKQDD